MSLAACMPPSVAVASFLGGLLPTAAAACPMCGSDTGWQLRALLAGDFVWNLAVTLAPIPILAALVGLVWLAAPWIVGE